LGTQRKGFRWMRASRTRPRRWFKPHLELLKAGEAGGAPPPRLCPLRRQLSVQRVRVIQAVACSTAQGLGFRGEQHLHMHAPASLWPSLSWGCQQPCVFRINSTVWPAVHALRNLLCPLPRMLSPAEQVWG
jgi:hypothetical protein